MECYRGGAAGLCSAILRVVEGCDGVDACNRPLFRHIGDERSHELGKGRLSDWELTIIDEVVSRRYNAMGCTLATTNYGPGSPTGAAPPNLSTTQNSGQTLGDRVGDRVYSRLLQLVDFVEDAGRDYRGPAVH